MPNSYEMDLYRNDHFHDIMGSVPSYKLQSSDDQLIWNISFA